MPADERSVFDGESSAADEVAIYDFGADVNVSAGADAGVSDIFANDIFSGGEISFFLSGHSSGNVEVPGGVDFGSFDEAVDDDAVLADDFEEVEYVLGDNDFPGKINVSDGEINIASDLKPGIYGDFVAEVFDLSFSISDDEIALSRDVFSEYYFCVACEFSGNGFSINIYAIGSGFLGNNAQELLALVSGNDVGAIIVALAAWLGGIFFFFFFGGVIGGLVIGLEEYFYASVFVMLWCSSAGDNDGFGDSIVGEELGKFGNDFFGLFIKAKAEVF